MDPADGLRAREQEWRRLFDIEPPTFVVGGKPIPPLSDLVPSGSNEVTTVQPGVAVCIELGALTRET